MTRVVAAQELRDLWLGGRGPVLVFLFSLLLSGVTYLASSNQALNFLEQREAVNLVVQVAVAVGVLVTLVVSADGISGERERGTLEALLLTPVPRRSILAGKLIAALSLWIATFAVSMPYIWVLAQGVGVLAEAATLGLVVGTLLAVGLACTGLLISSTAGSNRTSLAASVLLLIVLFAPSQLPGGLPQGWFFEILQRLDPVSSALAYIAAHLVHGHGWSQDLGYLVAPVLLLVLAGGTLVVAGSRLVRFSPEWGSR